MCIANVWPAPGFRSSPSERRGEERRGEERRGEERREREREREREKERERSVGLFYGDRMSGGGGRRVPLFGIFWRQPREGGRRRVDVYFTASASADTADEVVAIVAFPSFFFSLCVQAPAF